MVGKSDAWGRHHGFGKTQMHEYCADKPMVIIGTNTRFEQDSANVLYDQRSHYTIGLFTDHPVTAAWISIPL